MMMMMMMMKAETEGIRPGELRVKLTPLYYQWTNYNLHWSQNAASSGIQSNIFWAEHNL